MIAALVTAESTFSPARPPAIPLAVRSPYLSSEYIICPQGNLTSLTSSQPGKLLAAVAVTEATSQDSGLVFGSLYCQTCNSGAFLTP